MKNAGLPALILLASIAIESCSGNPGNEVKKSQSTPVVEGYVVKPVHLDNVLEVTGSVIPEDETVLMPEISGRITMLNIHEGEFVQKGTLIVKMFDADLQAQEAKIKAQLATARQTATRLEELQKLNGVSQQELDEAKTQVASLEAEQALLDAQITKTEIRAPFSGTLGLRKVSEGAYVTAGTPIVALRREDVLLLDFSVPENNASSVEKSARVYFTIASDTTTYTATVIATERQITQGSLNLQVRARVDQSNSAITPGTSARVRMEPKNKNEVLAIPSVAIIPDVRYKKVMVARNGKVDFATVETGQRTATQVEIISGLSNGDTVVTSGIQFLRKGSPAKFSSVR